MNKIFSRLMTVSAALAVVASAYCQNQAGFAEANQSVAAAAPGYSYRIDLKTNLTGAFYWDFLVAQGPESGARVRVWAADARVFRNRSVEVDDKFPRSGLNPVSAAGAAVAAANAKYGADSQIVRFEAIPRSDGSVRYRVLLNVLGDEGGALDQDVQVTLDSSGRVTKIERRLL